jgi:hypothetical protein
MSVLDAERLRERAAQQTGLSGWGDLPFEAGLEALLWALELEAGLGELAKGAAAAATVALLTKRLRLVEDRRQHPDIAAEEIVAPIVVLGLPRSGTTHLHSLLAQRDGSRVPLQWEMSLPSPPPEAATYETDPRIVEVQAALDARPGQAELMAIHPFGATRAEQCIGLLDWSFINSAFLAAWRMPSYYEWFLATDHRPAYEHHRRMLQQLQWRVPGDWVLKWPKHVYSMGALLATYPDARVVWTHRDPGQVVPSVVDFVGTVRRMSPGFDPVRFGAEWSKVEEVGLLRGLAERDRLVPPERVIDIHYNEIVADPEGAVVKIYQYFGMDVDEDGRKRIRQFQTDNPQTKHGRHTYAAEDFGLSVEGLRERFGTYIDRFGVEPDRAH